MHTNRDPRIHGGHHDRSKKLLWLVQAGQLPGIHTYLAKFPAALVTSWMCSPGSQLRWVFQVQTG